MIPQGSLVVVHGGLRKLFGVPVGVPKYRWHHLAFQDDVLVRPGDVVIGRERSPWFLAILGVGEGRPVPDAARTLIDHYHLVPLPSLEPQLAVYVGRAGPAGEPVADVR